MKRKKVVVIVCLVILLLGVFSAALPVLAADEITDPSLTDISTLFNLDSYQSYMGEDGWNFLRDLGASTWLNNAANIAFDFNKILYACLKIGMELFGGATVLTNYIDTFTVYSKALYDTLFTNFGLTIIVCMALYCLYLFLFKNPQRAFSQFGLFALVMIVAFGWNARGAEFVRWFNTISTEVQTSLITATTSGTGNSKQDALTSVNNTLFELAIQEPYLLINYGTADLSEINTTDNPKRSSELLFSGEATKEKYETVEDTLNDVKDDNEYLQTSKVGWKLVVAGLSPVMTLAVGIPLLTIQFMNFLVEIFALLISTFIGLSLFLSLIPRFNHAIWKVFGSLLGVFGIRILLGISLMLVTLVIRVVRSIIPSGGAGNYILQVLAICVVMFIVWKKRDTIISVVTGGVIQSTGGAVGKTVFDPLKQGAGNLARLGGKALLFQMMGAPSLLAGAGGNAKPDESTQNGETIPPQGTSGDIVNPEDDSDPSQHESESSKKGWVFDADDGDFVANTSTNEDDNDQLESLSDRNEALDTQELVGEGAFSDGDPSIDFPDDGLENDSSDGLSASDVTNALSDNELVSEESQADNLSASDVRDALSDSELELSDDSVHELPVVETPTDIQLEGDLVTRQESPQPIDSEPLSTHLEVEDVLINDFDTTLQQGDTLLDGTTLAETFHHSTDKRDALHPTFDGESPLSETTIQPIQIDSSLSEGKRPTQDQQASFKQQLDDMRNS